MQSANSVERLVNDPEGGGVQVFSAGMVSPSPDLLDSALGCALLLASVLGCAERRVRKAGGCSHLTPGSLDQE